jgi:hypothetical protein
MVPLNPNITEKACEAIEKFAENDDNIRVKLAAAGACVSVVEALRAFPSNAVGSEQACGAIMALCCTSPGIW